MSQVETVINSFLSGPIRANTITRPSNATAYAAGQVVSNVTTNAHFTFGQVISTIGQSGRDSMSRAGYLTGTINHLQLISSSADAKSDMELWLYETDIANVADGSVFGQTDAESLTRVMVIDIPALSWKVGLAGSGNAGNASVQIRNIDTPYRASTGVLYGQLVVRTASTPVSAETYTGDLFRTID